MRGFSKTQLAGFFLTGAAVGAAVALLYAPKTGAQTRKDIRRFSKKAVGHLDDGYQQVMEVFDNVKEYVEDGKNKIQKMIQTA